MNDKTKEQKAEELKNVLIDILTPPKKTKLIYIDGAWTLNGKPIDEDKLMDAYDILNEQKKQMGGEDDGTGN